MGYPRRRNLRKSLRAFWVLFESEPYHTTIIHCYQAIIPFLIVYDNIASDNGPYVKNTEKGRKS